MLTGIVHRLSNPEIKYMFQQYARREGAKHALIDLYLPQFRIAIEVDEAQHNSDYGMMADEERLKEIAQQADTDMKVFALDAMEPNRQDSYTVTLSGTNKICINPLAIEFEEFAKQHLGNLCEGGSAKEHKMFVLRVICYDEAGPKSFEELNSSIDFVVRIIKYAYEKSKKSGVFKPFDNKEPVKHYQETCEFSIDDDTELESVTDICACFGAPRVSTGSREFADKYLIWWPKEGFEGNDWINELSEDGTTILESPKSDITDPIAVKKARDEHFEGCKSWGVKHQESEYPIRIVFYRRLDAMKSNYYSFKGVFQLTHDRSQGGKCVWKRIEGGDKFKLPKPYDSTMLKKYVETLESVRLKKRRKSSAAATLNDLIKEEIEAAECRMRDDLNEVAKQLNCQPSTSYNSTELKEFAAKLKAESQKRKPANAKDIREQIDKAETQMLNKLYHSWKNICKIDKDNKLGISYSFAENYSDTKTLRKNVGGCFHPYIVEN